MVILNSHNGVGAKGAGAFARVCHYLSGLRVLKIGCELAPLQISAPLECLSKIHAFL